MSDTRAAVDTAGEAAAEGVAGVEDGTKKTIDQLPVLPTAVVGSYPVPEWLARLKNDYHRGRLSPQRMSEVEDLMIMAAVKDQEQIGIDIVSDGELRRDNEVDYVLERLPGVEILSRPKSHYFEHYQARIRKPIEVTRDDPLGLVDEFAYVDRLTDQPITFSMTGPFSLSRRLHNEAYRDDADLVYALARILHSEAEALTTAGAQILQLDEPYLAGYPEAAELAVRAINLVTEGVEAHWAVHVCYGNRYSRPSWEGHYDFLFPAFLEARVDELVLEFARKGYDDLALFAKYPSELKVGVGVIDVKSPEVEPPAVVVSRLRQALKVLPPEKIAVNPDCGLRHLRPSAARDKVVSMTTATHLLRSELAGTCD